MAQGLRPPELDFQDTQQPFLGKAPPVPLPEGPTAAFCLREASKQEEFRLGIPGKTPKEEVSFFRGKEAGGPEALPQGPFPAVQGSGKEKFLFLPHRASTSRVMIPPQTIPSSAATSAVRSTA